MGQISRRGLDGAGMFDVILMTRTDASIRHGGSGLTIHWLLKLQHKNRAPEVSMHAVFGDIVVSSYPELVSRFVQSEEITGPRRPASKHSWLPKSFRLYAEYAFAVVRFLSNLRVALNDKDGSNVILHAHDLTSSYFSFLWYRRKHPRVFTIHSRGGWVREWITEHIELRGTIVERILRYMEDTAVREADVIVFTSQGSRALFESYHPRLLDKKRVEIVYSGADLDELDLIAADDGVVTRCGLTNGRRIVLCVAAMVEDKGLDCLVDAIALMASDVLDRVYVVMVGQGPLREVLLSRVVHVGLEQVVRFLGFLPRTDLVQLMKASTVFVLPSRAAVFDAVLLEAGALGLPIITTSVGGNLEMYDQGSALLVPPGDPGILSAALVRLLADDGLRSRLGEGARRRIREMFPVRRLLRSYVSVYEQAWEAWRGTLQSTTDASQVG
jgi:glycosyltransferase involved in cell wall biosynthesis